MPVPGTIRRLWMGSILAILLALTAGSAPALAAYAGANGRIAFTANIRSVHRWDLFTMRPGGKAVRRLTSVPGNSPFAAPDWSPHGSRLLFTSGQVYRINADGSGLTKLTHITNADTGEAMWSPDGSKIVFKRQRSGEYAIWVMKSDGTHRRKLTNERNDSNSPTFTPDGRNILFSSEKGGLSSAIWIMNADGSNKRRLTPAALEAFGPDVSPDGSHVVFRAGGSALEPESIYTMTIDGSQITRLTDPGCCHHDGFAKYSPDGKKIVFVTDRNYPLFDGMDIYKMNADGTNQRQVTTNLTAGGWPDSPFFNGVAPDWGAEPPAG